MATSGGNNLMTYHQFLAAEQQQQAAEGGPQIFQSDSCHKFAHLCGLTLRESVFQVCSRRENMSR